ncbi:MAG: response regulator [Candidatus Margulisbacteria bacterium]|nr:response regulator [Candidatus Margulisiibacteriota bacterium]
MKVMVVDDEVVSRKKLAKIVEELGIIHEFDRGDVALVAFEKALKEKQPYQLITLDISMPDMDGLDVLNRIRQLEVDYKVAPDKQTKVVMVTSHDERDSILAALSEKCSDYIVKPFNKEFIMERFRRIGVI